MADTSLVCQEGKVVGENGGKFQVKIVSRSACAECHAKGMCTTLEMQEKIIDAVPSNSEPIKIGDSVQIIMEEKLGMKAVLFGFLLPLVVLLAVLFISYGVSKNETMAALLGIASLVPYYFFLYLFRGKIEKEFIFRLEKIYV